MSGHNINYELYNSAVAGTNVVDDPGSSGTIDLKGKSGGWLSAATSGTRTLPATAAGVTLTVHASANAPVFADAAANTIVTLGSDKAAVVTSMGGNLWLSGPILAQSVT